jgi:hypothetical protein
LWAIGASALVAAGCSLDPSGEADSSSGVPDSSVTTHDAVADTALPPVGDVTVPDAVEEGPSFGPDAQAEAASDAPLDGDARVSPPDASDAGDAARDAQPDTCAPHSEVCNDGIDNDCNGLTDCADPACVPKWSCATAVPAGWSLVEYADGARPGCDPSYGTATDLVDTPTGDPATCACPCNVDPANKGSCVHGSYDVAYNGSTTSCPATSFSVASNDGACVPLGLASFNSVPGAKAKITPLPYTPGTCTATLQKSVPPVQYQGQGRSCALTTTTGAGCASGGTCAPKTSGAFNACVQQAGAQSCPAGFGTRYVVGTLSDTRDCTGACGCQETGSCQNTKVTYFSNVGCNGTSAEVTADGQCDPNNENTPHMYTSYKYSADVTNVQCNGSGATPSGAVGLNGTTTVCCP